MCIFTHLAKCNIQILWVQVFGIAVSAYAYKTISLSRSLARALSLSLSLSLLIVRNISSDLGVENCTVKLGIARECTLCSLSHLNHNITHHVISALR